MGVVGRIATRQGTCPLGLGPLVAVGGISARTGPQSDASEVLQASLGLGLVRLLDQEVKLAGPGVSLDLSVLLLPVTLQEPPPKLAVLVFRKRFDRQRQFFKPSHIDPPRTATAAECDGPWSGRNAARTAVGG